MNDLMAKHTGRPVERIERDTDRDRCMGAEEAKEYGLIDSIVTSRVEVPEPTKASLPRAVQRTGLRAKAVPRVGTALVTTLSQAVDIAGSVNCRVCYGGLILG